MITVRSARAAIISARESLDTSGRVSVAALVISALALIVAILALRAALPGAARA